MTNRGNPYHEPAGTSHGGEFARKAGASAQEAAGLGKQDTLQQYCANGVWDPERVKLHNRIVASFFDGKSPVACPKAWLLGGGSAAGKTTLIKSGRLGIPDNTVWADADAIKFMLPEMQQAVARGDLTGAMVVHEESAYLSKVVAKKAAAEDYNIAMDGIGNNGFENLKQKVDLLDGENHPLEAVYVTVDTDIAVKRSWERAQQTGRMSSEAILRAGHRSVSLVFPAAVAGGIFRKFSLYDTNFSPQKKIAYGTRTKLHIIDPVAYQRFLDKAKE